MSRRVVIDKRKEILQRGTQVFKRTKWWEVVHISVHFDIETHLLF